MTIRGAISGTRAKSYPDRPLNYFVLFFSVVILATFLSGCAPASDDIKSDIVLTGAEATKFDGGLIVIGSAISFTGRYSTNGIHTSNGYNLAAMIRLSAK